MTRTPSRPFRKRITPYLPSDLAQRLEGHCATARVTESAAVEAAVRQYLDGTGDKTLLMQRMDRLGRAQERARRNQELHTESFVVFVKLWLGYVPNVPKESRKEALVAVDGRFKQFLDLVGHRMSKIQRFADQLAHEPVADPRELATMAETPAQTDPRGSGENG
jgi:hypothetical protein